MPEFHLLRLLLALAEFALILAIFRRRRAPSLAYLLPFSLLLWSNATSHLIPALLTSPRWWLLAYLPLASIRFLLATFVSIDFFHYLRGYVRLLERAAVGASALLAGLTLAWFLRWWRPADPVDTANVLRQYAWLVLASAFSLYLHFFTAAKPVKNSAGDVVPTPAMIDHASLWATWLWTMFFASTATRGGLLWLVFKWDDNEIIWRVTGDLVLFVQFALCWCWWLNLRTTPLPRKKRRLRREHEYVPSNSVSLPTRLAEMTSEAVSPLAHTTLRSSLATPLSDFPYNPDVSRTLHVTPPGHGLI